MDKQEQEHKKFLEQQVEWCKKQDRILEEIELKLHEMKKIAQYALEHVLSPIELEGLNTQLIDLKNEVHLLKKQLHFCCPLEKGDVIVDFVLMSMA